MGWIQVSDLVGRTVYISTEQLVRVRPFVAPNDAPAAGKGRAGKEIDMSAAKSVLDLVGIQQTVREAPDEIMKRIEIASREKTKEAVA
jgi:hypothetical protein